MKTLLESTDLFKKARAAGFDDSVAQRFSSYKDEVIRPLPRVPQFLL